MKIDRDYIVNCFENYDFDALDGIIKTIYSLDSHNFISKEALIEIVRFQKDQIDQMNDYINDEPNRVKGFQY